VHWAQIAYISLVWAVLPALTLVTCLAFAWLLGSKGPSRTVITLRETFTFFVILREATKERCDFARHRLRRRIQRQGRDSLPGYCDSTAPNAA
jgi:hypothetical protein